MDPPPCPSPTRGEGTQEPNRRAPVFGAFFVGPWRAVPVLGITQILTWGAMFYPPVLIVPRIAADRGWSISFAMGGFSLALLVAGIAARYVGGSIDRLGGHVTMTLGSLIGCVGLLSIVYAPNPVAYYAAW